MRPVTFGGRFGWFHPAPGGRGVVLCPALAHEGLCAQRAWRELAERLAAAGLPTLRFDYHGTGDSVGDDEEPGRVRAWLDSVGAAEAWLRREAGVAETVLVGLRLGAALAAVAAAELGGVKALALLAPVVSGRAHARELKALMMVAAAAPGAPDPPPPSTGGSGDVEAGGFVFTAETLEDLRRLDLLALPRAPARHVLLLRRPGPSAPADARLAAALRGLGCDVREGPFDGYDELMRDVNLAVPPRAAFDLLADWLAAADGWGTAPPPAPHPPDPGAGACPAPGRLEMADAVEELAAFGDDVPLFGVCCAPRQEPARADRPALLFVNTGANHHVGANRLAVLLGRRLAGRGVTSFRIDVAGIGDSAARPGRAGTPLYDQESCADVRAALDWLEERGFRRCVVVGVCSGAYLALRHAPADERVAGLVLVNPQRFVWRAGDSLEIQPRRSFRSTTFYLDMARRPRTWLRAIRGEVNVAGILGVTARRLMRRAGGRLGEVRGRISGTPGERRRVADDFAALSARGVDVLLVYAAEDGGLDELEGHFGRGGRRLARLPNTGIRILKGADHTLSARWMRERLALLVEARLGLGGDGTPG